MGILHLPLGDGKKINVSCDETGIELRADSDGQTDTLRLHPSAAKMLGQYLTAVAVVSRN